ncbi:DNA replication/repair protein RecF [Solitalea koreensis]|uniref:DNA replication and repair protein RecF n=1 Tax=Solitalea koreensis TaxID=543615 RepID=A0A521B0Z1_9SPHI|nr:DNA replication and repair protein RecF [Solitalea koreensis]SMO40773.1 DNA replication and repair protein RecF [Solitalea koreensis]
MYLQKLTLLNFKNYIEAELHFNDGVNCFVGNNGAGKTNLLDAIHYLSLCKSYFNPVDSQQIRYEQDYFMLQGVFEKGGNEEVIFCGLKKNQKKQFKRNKKDYGRLVDHIGQFPLVMISPYDISLVIEGSEERRKFVDNVISQTDNRYLDMLIVYNKNLANRNSLLRQFADRGAVDEDLLSIYDEQIISAGTAIYHKRKAFLETFTEIFNKHYKYISAEAEQVTLVYESQLNTEDFAAGLKRTLAKDRVLQRTNFGIHKDELEFGIHGYALKKFGSQGQQKSFLIALKLAQYSYLYQVKGFKPLLLLDDIFDKLDDLRIKKLMQMVVQDNFGQIFITDTNRERTEKVFNEIGVPINVFEVYRGEIVAMDKDPVDKSESMNKKQ